MDSVDVLRRLYPVVTLLENLFPGDCDTVVAVLENLLRASPAPALQTQPEPLRQDCDNVAVQVKTLLRLYPSPEEQRKLFELLQRLHPADARTFVENLLPVSPAPALQIQPGPLRPDCDTMVAASVLCGVVSADSPKFGCDSDHYFYGAEYDVDYSNYSDYDEYDELDCYSDVYGGVDPANYFAPNDMEFMHELHDPDNCGVYCQLRYEIRPYGHYAPTDGELSRGMNDPANYNPGPPDREYDGDVRFRQ